MQLARSIEDKPIPPPEDLAAALGRNKIDLVGRIYDILGVRRWLARRKRLKWCASTRHSAAALV